MKENLFLYSARIIGFLRPKERILLPKEDYSLNTLRSRARTLKKTKGWEFVIFPSFGGFRVIRLK